MEKRFRTLKIVAWIIEYVGWLCAGLGALGILVALGKMSSNGRLDLGDAATFLAALVPIATGLVMVVLAQVARCFAAIEENTRQTEFQLRALGQSIGGASFKAATAAADDLEEQYKIPHG